LYFQIKFLYTFIIIRTIKVVLCKFFIMNCLFSKFCILIFVHLCVIIIRVFFVIIMIITMDIITCFVRKKFHKMWIKLKNTIKIITSMVYQTFKINKVVWAISYWYFLVYIYIYIYIIKLFIDFLFVCKLNIK